MKYATTLVICILLCFTLASRKIFNLIGSFYPVAQPEECVKINVDGIPVKLVILANNNKTHMSLVFVLNDRSIHQVSYGELRDMDAEKVSCE